MTFGSEIAPWMLTFGLPMAFVLVGIFIGLAIVLLTGGGSNQRGAYMAVGAVSGLVAWKASLMLLGALGISLAPSSDGGVELSAAGFGNRSLLPPCTSHVSMAEVRRTVEANPAVKAMGVAVTAVVKPELISQTPIEVSCMLRLRISDGQVWPMYYRSQLDGDGKTVLFQVQGDRFEE